MLGVYVYAKPILGRNLQELEGDFLLDPDDLPASGGSDPGAGGGGSGGGGGGGVVVSGGGVLFYGDESGGSEVSDVFRAFFREDLVTRGAIHWRP